MTDLTKNEDLPPGLRQPYKWGNPVGLDEILHRLLDARDYNVPERERENMCSVAHGTITKMRASLVELTLGELSTAPCWVRAREIIGVKKP